MMYLKSSQFRLTIILAFLLLLVSCRTVQKDKTNETGKEVTLLLKPRPGNPKNFSGDMIRLKDGRILYLYAYGVGDRVADDAPYCTVARYSSDNGKTWTQDDVIMHIEGGLSFLRLPDGRLALFYLRFGNSKKELYPYMIISEDESRTWSKPIKCVNEPGYYTINNDRVIQMKNGRIILPVAYYGFGEIGKNSGIYVYYSDDSGRSWHKSLRVPNPQAIDLQEPGVIELKNGDLMMFMRTRLGVQYLSFSHDNGKRWSAVQPSSIRSPLSPASIKRIPSTGDLLLVWNDHYNPDHRDGGIRTPLTMAISNDEGKTWQKKKVIECDPNGWYCYTAIRFFGDYVLLAHSAGNTETNVGLEATQITRLSLDWVYKDATPNPVVKSDSAGTVILDCADKSAKIYYSLQRKMPDILYTEPIKISHPTPLWIQARAGGKTKSYLITTYAGKDIVQPPDESADAEGQGLVYKYYEGKAANVDGIKNLDIKLRGISPDFNIGKRMRDFNFAFEFDGYIRVPQDGRYTFYLASNDGSVLYLDDFELINHDGAHALTEKSAETTLRKGMHKIVLKYFQLLGGRGLKVSWKGPGFDKQEIPNSVLFYGKR